MNGAWFGGSYQTNTYDTSSF